MPLEPTVGMESLFEMVWGDLNDENVEILGFVWNGRVVVSKDSQIQNIQNDIGERIGYFDEARKNKSLDQKAGDIFSFFSRRRFVLLLDDMWEMVDFTKVGVPLPDRQTGTKIVFTTRSKYVCFLMEANRKVQVKCWEKSWELFREKVGEDALNVHPEITSFAKNVAKECGGLPLALITIGRSMACKRKPHEWNYAIRVLKNSASKFSSMGRLGYDFIGTLLYACLLQEDGFAYVKMHDVIHDMASWIGCGRGKCSV
ncbi:hypothetical protein TIFTF001_033877 [Ficus carica]|uniref:NB-ARC domain-containing protein n=1 Tax=Ficus carica TaxID=3494 RepID=A0AA88J9X8_FICCA|nr:hypothetical protein TIFTF001_033877 [Ficus carica]